MASRPSSLNDKPVRPGIYEIQSSTTGLFLNSFEDPVYNGRCDDALTLKKLPTRRGNWKLESVGDGYTIKQVISGLYCALADGEQFIFQSVVLSSVPTVWTIKHIHEESDQVRITWSVSDVAWEVYGSKDERVLVINGLKPADSSDSDIDEKPERPPARATFDWNLLPVEMPVADGGKIRPGLYSLQNMFSKTYVMMGPDGKLSCWPKFDFRNGDTKLWDIDPGGEGYTIRLHGTDKYCTLVETMNKGDTLPIHLSTCPATWKILPNESAAHESDDYFQIFWGNTQNTWDLHTPGKDKPGTPVNLRTNNNYNPCRLFRFIP